MILAGFPECKEEEVDFEYFLTNINFFNELYLYLIFEEELRMKEFYIVKNINNITERRRRYEFLSVPVYVCAADHFDCEGEWIAWANQRYEPEYINE